jgi:benzylsuccinate CoA-transferase BbsF subunit
MGRMRPLAGVRVLDFTWAWAGPHCTRLLADMGAEVLRIESRERLDHHRHNGPWPDGVPGGPNRGGNFNQLNRNKQSITINLKHPDGVELALRLAAVCDVVVSNFAPGVMERLGLGYDAMRARNPGLIWAAVSGFGMTGPQAGHVTFGPPMTFYSGLASITGYGPGDEPRMLGSTYCDSVAGGHAAIAVLAALHHRHRSGEGQLIDVSMLEAMLCFLPEMVLDYTIEGVIRRPLGNADDVYVPQGVYPALADREQGTGNSRGVDSDPQSGDCWIALTVKDETQWQALIRVIGRPDLACLADPVARRARIGEIDEAISAWTACREQSAAFLELQQAGVPASPCHDAKGMVEDPHLNARGFWVTDPHPETGPRTIAGMAWKLSETPGGLDASAPLLGVHTRPALRRLLGLTDTALDELEAAGVLR